MTARRSDNKGCRDGSIDAVLVMGLLEGGWGWEEEGIGIFFKMPNLVELKALVAAVP